MKITETSLEGVFIVEPKVFNDGRGYFFESWTRREFESAGLNYLWVQDNQSMSFYGTVRGIHFQKGKYAQTKLVRVLQGRVLDVAVDLRKNSPTFGQHIAVELNEDNHYQLLIPRGFGHGFSVLSDTAIFAYKCDSYYKPESEGSVNIADKSLGINWKIDKNKMLLSDKDINAQSFEEYSRLPAFTYGLEV